MCMRVIPSVVIREKPASKRPRIRSTSNPYATSFRRRFFAYHNAMTHPHSNIILSLFSIHLVLKCAAKILKIGVQIKI